MAATMLQHPAPPPKPRPALRVMPRLGQQIDDLAERRLTAHTRCCPRCGRWLDCDCIPRERCECSMPISKTTTTPVLRVEAREEVRR